MRVNLADAPAARDGPARSQTKEELVKAGNVGGVQAFCALPVEDYFFRLARRGRTASPHRRTRTHRQASADSSALTEVLAWPHRRALLIVCWR